MYTYYKKVDCDIKNRKHGWEELEGKFFLRPKLNYVFKIGHYSCKMFYVSIKVTTKQEIYYT